MLTAVCLGRGMLPCELAAGQVIRMGDESRAPDYYGFLLSHTCKSESGYLYDLAVGASLTGESRTLFLTQPRSKEYDEGDVSFG